MCRHIIFILHRISQGLTSGTRGVVRGEPPYLAANFLSAWILARGLDESQILLAARTDRMARHRLEEFFVFTRKLPEKGDHNSASLYYLFFL